jgi:hypothetical protein
VDSKKLLSDISGLTRNLESLVKEIRESNKINSSSQKAISQIAESDKKSEKSAETKTAETENQGKASAKNQDKFFSKLLTTIEKSFIEGNQNLKKSNLKTLEEAGKSILASRTDGKNIGSILKNAGKKSLVNFAISKTPEAISMIASKIKKAQELKEKEKIKKEEGADLTPTGEEKIKARREKREEKRKQELASKTEKVKKEKSEEKKISLQRITERIIEKEKKLTEKTTPTETPKSVENPTAEEVKKIPTLEEVSKTPKVEKEEGKFKKAAKEAFLKTELGSTVQKISTLVKKEKKTAEDGTEMNRAEGLKSKMSLLFSKKETPKSTEPQKELSKGPESSSESQTAEKPISTEGQQSTSTPESQTPMASSKESESPQKESITAKDIQDIKSLLSSISSSLSGPLRIKENKPFRPKSNMLE